MSGPSSDSTSASAVTCPFCHSVVRADSGVCGICGHQLRPDVLQGGPLLAGKEEANRERRRRRIILAILVLAIVIGGVSGYFAYDRLWLNNPVWNAAVEPSFASRAVDNLSPICLSSGSVVNLPTNSTYWIVLGLRNRSGYDIETKWTLTSYDESVGYSHSRVQVFHLAGNGDAYPTFWNMNNATDIARLRSDDFLRINLGLSLSAAFNVTGVHGVYHFTRIGGTKGLGPSTGYLLDKIVGGQPGMILGPPPCPDSVLPST